MAYLGMSGGSRWRTARVLPLLFGLVGSICNWVPLAQAATCTGCGNPYGRSGDACSQQVGVCFTSIYNANFHFTTYWTRTECTNGYTISGCVKNQDGCCNDQHPGPSCNNGSYCT